MEIKFLTAGIMVALAAFAAALGNSWLFSKYVEGAFRQPEVRGSLFTQLMILFGLVEALPIIAVGLGILVFFGFF